MTARHDPPVAPPDYEIVVVDDASPRDGERVCAPDGCSRARRVRAARPAAPGGGSP